MLKIGVVFSGCGVLDGSEIHESVLTLLALAKHGAEAVCMAPNVEQYHVINHLTNQETHERRNVLVESARIARGKIKDIDTVKASEINGLIFPGGYGAAKNLCTFAFDGPDCSVNPNVKRLVQEVHQAGKPIGAICIAPALVAKIFQNDSVKLTIGNDPETASAIEKLGHQHVICQVQETCVDPTKKIVSTPAYMLARNLAEAYSGIEKLVKEVINICRGNS